MFFRKKYDRAMEVLKEKNKREEAGIAEENWEEQSDRKEETEVFEKNDRLAMTLSAFMVFIPAALLILGVFALLSLLIGLL